MLTEVTGPKTTDFIMNGIFEAYANVSVQQRITLGNLPGMQQVWSILGTVGIPTGAKPYELFGAPGAYCIRYTTTDDYKYQVNKDLDKQ